MESSEIILHNTVLEYVFRYLYDQVKKMGGKVIKYSKNINYSDGTSNKVTYFQTIQYVQPPKNNRLAVQFSYVIQPDGKPAQGFMELMPAMEFEGWQLQNDTVLLKVEFAPLYKPYIDNLFSDLNEKFGSIAEKPKGPEKPSTGASREDWFRFKSDCDKAGYKFTHNDLAKELHLSPGYVRQLYNTWKSGEES